MRSEYDAHNAMREAMQPKSQGCILPPAGWFCTREPGHPGPCAAWPYQPHEINPPSCDDEMTGFAKFIGVMAAIVVACVALGAVW